MKIIIKIKSSWSVNSVVKDYYIGIQNENDYRFIGNLFRNYDGTWGWTIPGDLDDCNGEVKAWFEQQELARSISAGDLQEKKGVRL